MSTPEKPLAGQIKHVDRPEAPIIFFDGAPVLNHFNHIISVSLSTAISKPTADGKLEVEVATVAHLRTNIEGAMSLRDAIDKALLLAAPAKGDANN